MAIFVAATKCNVNLCYYFAAQISPEAYASSTLNYIPEAPVGPTQVSPLVEAHPGILTQGRSYQTGKTWHSPLQKCTQVFSRYTSGIAETYVFLLQRNAARNGRWPTLWDNGRCLFCPTKQISCAWAHLGTADPLSLAMPFYNLCLCRIWDIQISEREALEDYLVPASTGLLLFIVSLLFARLVVNFWS